MLSVDIKREKKTQIDNVMKDSDIYNAGVAKTVNANLLGFKEPSDDEREVRRGDRPFDGGRGRGGPRGGRGGVARGGPSREGPARGGASRPSKGGLLNERDFPTL